MSRSEDSPHRIQLARRPEHISDAKEDATVNALTVLAHGGTLKSAKRSRNLAAADAEATIDRLLRGANAPAAGEPPTSPVRGHAGDVRPTGRPIALGALPVGLPPLEERIAVVRHRLRRTALVPSVLTVPCAEHEAAAGEYCFGNVARGVCWRRVQRRAATR
ncbi:MULTISPECIES: hypothetical protein [unclassified Microbacterium]|uniref:hypothetical protein n=1 Tax=unclassified Microbacterium TaxID=2609290 RepID=UPI003019B950